MVSRLTKVCQNTGIKVILRKSQNWNGDGCKWRRFEMKGIHIEAVIKKNEERKKKSINF